VPVEQELRPRRTRFPRAECIGKKAGPIDIGAGLFICLAAPAGLAPLARNPAMEPSKTLPGLNCVLSLPAQARMQDPSYPFSRSSFMNINLTFGPVVSLIAGVLILIMPRLLNYIIALYLIVIGLVGLFGTGNLHL
jgi:hypothetical protein